MVGEEPDANTNVGDSGILLRFTSTQALPHNYIQGSYDVIATEARLELVDLRFLGDVAGGDETRRDFVRVEWPSGKEVAFPDAPPGIYSGIRARLVDFEVKGSFTGGSVITPQNFDFDFNESEPISFDVGFTLNVNETIGVEVAIDWEQLTSGIAFDQMPWDDDDNERELDEDMENRFLANIQTAFGTSQGPID
jgi:hypothetical protein